MSEKKEIEQSPEEVNGENPNVNEEPQTTSYNPQTKNMEVHHHPDLHHKKKNFKEYFLEFLMIFLAVTMGFFAESYREHVVEKNHEKEFIQSFIEDLKTDTASARTIIRFRQNKLEKLDSFLLLLGTHKINGYENDLYFFGRTLIRTNWFQSNDRTIIQLKNSGSLRLIKNEPAADSIISYQKAVELIEGNQTDERDERFNSHSALSRMFNPFVFDSMVSIDGIKRPTDNPSLRSYDPNVQQDLAFYVHMIKGSTFLIEKRLEQLNIKATKIIDFLKKEYHLN